MTTDSSSSIPKTHCDQVTPSPDAEVPGARGTLLILFLLMMVNFMDRQIMAGVAGPMQKSLSLTDMQIGALQTIFLVCVAAFALPSAFILDRTGRKYGIAALGAAWNLATGLTGMAGNFITLCASRAFVGIGEAGFLAGGTALLSAAYPERNRAKVLGIFNAAIPLGAAIGTVLSSMIAAKTGSWAAPFYVFAAVGLVFSVLALALITERKAPRTEGLAFRATLRALLCIPTLRALYIGQTMNAFLTMAMLQWLPVYLSRSYEVDSTTAGKRAGLVFVCAIVGAPIGGFIADRWSKSNPRGRALSCAVTSFLAALCLTGGLLLGPSKGGFICLLAWGVLTPAYIAPCLATTLNMVHPKVGATAVGLGTLVSYLFGGAPAPTIVGAISDNVSGNIGSALLILPMAGVLASLAFLWASRSYTTDLKEIRATKR